MELVKELLTELPENARVITDFGGDPPSPWRGYQLCLKNISPGATHACILQDDTKVCQNFGETVRRVASRNAGMPVSLFLMPQPMRIARQAIREAKSQHLYFDARFRINEHCPVLGLLWPVEKAAEFLQWVEENPRRLGHPHPRSDDGVVGKWCANTHQTIRFTIPSLVDHLADQPSVKGGPTPASKMKALWFAEDGARYDW